jgi:hypothetical protein
MYFNCVFVGVLAQRIREGLLQLRLRELNELPSGLYFNGYLDVSSSPAAISLIATSDSPAVFVLGVSLLLMYRSGLRHTHTHTHTHTKRERERHICFTTSHRTMQVCTGKMLHRLALCSD